MSSPDILEALAPVVDVFELLGVRYQVGGSVASSVHGVARSTLDIDLVADIREKDVVVFTRALEADYYIDSTAIMDAIHRRASFNLVHLGTMIKIDVFIVKDRPYDTEALSRRRFDTLDEDSSSKFYLSSPEDAVLSKLQWYEDGGRVSEQQWKDILGVLKVQRDKLDLEYIKYWASNLNVSELLNRSFNDAGIIESS